ncbi:hypothetical protein AQUCO_01200097v1 [Aquilegia coerulea]|uniref:Uncharacterized protein n=1 Tax=Aquilegia coerulea TaxID=218851 RepID=A0A2G5E507_AQUCA|nr:hypothetical protein AQUCO_01200097v1 [Aquilegia coerulea]
MHSENFSSWLRDKIFADDDTNISETLKCLAFGPRSHASSYSGYIINGQRYHRKDVENSTQNSGVSLEATTMNPIASKVTFYGGTVKLLLLLSPMMCWCYMLISGLL